LRNYNQVKLMYFTSLKLIGIGIYQYDAIRSAECKPNKQLFIFDLVCELHLKYFVRKNEIPLPSLYCGAVVRF
jgi:hypothetical protein